MEIEGTMGLMRNKNLENEYAKIFEDLGVDIKQDIIIDEKNEKKEEKEEE